MSFTYNGDPSESEVAELRFMLGDTDPNNALFTDEEIQYLYDLYGDDELRLKYEVFTRAATKFAWQVKRTLGPQTEDPSDRLGYFRAQADAAQKQLSGRGVYLPRWQAPKQFYKGMMDNPPKPYWQHVPHHATKKSLKSKVTPKPYHPHHHDDDDDGYPVWLDEVEV